MKARSAGFWVIVLPIATAMAMVGPGMVSRADGCSGAAQQPQPGWNGLYGVDQPNTPTSGVYLLRGQLMDLSDEAALGLLAVNVQDGAGKPVPGSLALHSMSEPGSGYRDVIVSWKPDAPFAPDQTYAVSWSAGASVADSGSATLTTVSDPAPPAAPSVKAEKVGVRWTLAGELVSCSKVPYESHFDYGTCTTKTTGSGPFGSEEVLLTEVTFRVAPSSIEPSSASLTRVEPVPGKGELSLPASAVFLASALSPEVKYPVLQFSGDGPEYCARFVTEDLASGSFDTKEVCASPDGKTSPGPSLLEKELAKCDAPPKPELEAAWCKSHADAEECGGSGCSTRAPGRGSSWLGGAALLLAALLRRARPARAGSASPARRTPTASTKKSN